VGSQGAFLCGSADVRHVDHGVLEPVTIEHFAAGARHQGTRFLRRHPLAAFPHGIFERGPIPSLAPGLKIGIRPLRQKHAPRGFEAGAGLIESCGGAVGALPGMRARVEATRPAPRILVMRNAGAERDRAHVHVAIIDVPAVLAFGIAAAGEGGHTLLKRSAERSANYQSLGDWKGEEPQRLGGVGRDNDAPEFPPEPAAGSASLKFTQAEA
jgi:hypothetical protein